MLPAALLVALNNIAPIGRALGCQPAPVGVFKTPDGYDRRQRLQERLKHRSGIRGITYISADDALSKMQNLGDLAEIIQGLDRKPLPSTLIITPY